MFFCWYKSNLSCPLNWHQGELEQQQDDQEHLLKCETLPAKLSPEQLKHIHGICHQYIYHDTTRQTLAVTGLSWLLETWDKLLEATTPASWATLVAASSGGNRKLS